MIKRTPEELAEYLKSWTVLKLIRHYSRAAEDRKDIVASGVGSTGQQERWRMVRDLMNAIEAEAIRRDEEAKLQAGAALILIEANEKLQAEFRQLKGI